MSIKAAVSAVALASAMMIAPAMAQDAELPTTIGGVTVTAEDQAAVQAKCDELAAADGAASLSDSTEDNASGDSTTPDPTGATDHPPAEGLENATSTIDLSVITLEDCTADGWVNG
jgi:hypothetical protein